MRVCQECGVEKPLTKYKKSSASPTGETWRSRTCRECVMQRPQYVGYHLEKRYGITQRGYHVLLERQGGTCAFRDCTETGGSRALVVDHDHACCPGRTSCGRCVRALLCDRHNLLLGHLRDSVEEARRAVEYLSLYGDAHPTVTGTASLT